MDKNNVEQLFKKLSEEDRKRVENILADKNKTQQILNTPQAQALIKKLMGDQ
ncbi:MAG: hypothetical protein VZR73_03460 [Acutalibacteraceae bacterium]|nr:hypothetical protein [Clostridia bacterium]MEE3403124.1 hypothetical protein [Acutalibacteraceae bacterium]